MTSGPGIATSPELPGVNDRGTNWTTISVHDFPALTVPAGFTTQVMPVGIDVLALPFGEPVVFAIGEAFESATHYRHPPPAFGPLG